MRLFVGIKLDQGVTDYLAGLREECPLPGDEAEVKWLKAPQLHLTLRFLGDVPDSQLPKICEVVDRVSRSLNPFDLKVDGVDCFPDHGAVRIIWAKLRDEGGTLARCFSDLEAELTALGFSPERRELVPHVTLARVRYDRSRGQLREGVGRISPKHIGYAVTTLSLFQSKLLAAGAEYSELFQTILGSGIG